MSTELHDELRDYAEWLNASAPPIEELAPVGQPTPAPDRRVPGWTRGVLALAAVLMIGIPLALLLDGFGSEIGPADTITSFPVDGPVVLIADNGTMVLGKDHPPGSIVEVELNAARFDDVVLPPTEVGPDGRFEVVLWPEHGLRDGETAIVRVLSGELRTEDPATYVVVQLGIAFDLLDAKSDVAVGRARVPDGTSIQVRIESGTELTVVETETFNGAWEVDLSGTVDVTLESVGTAWVASGDGVASTAPRSAVPRPPELDLFMGGDWFFQGAGWTPGAQAELRVNGEPLGAPVTVGAGGRFEIYLGDIELESGDELAVDDGEMTASVSIHELVLDAHDPQTGVVSGTTDLVDGSVVSISHEASAPVETVVGNGRFSVAFEPGPLSELSVGYLEGERLWVAGIVAIGSDEGGTSPPSPAPSADQGVVVLFDGELEISGFGLVPGDPVDVELVTEGEVAFSAQDVTSVGADGSFDTLFEGVVFADGEALVTIGETTFVVPVVQINLVRIFDATDQVGVGFEAPIGANTIVWVANGGDRTGIPGEASGRTQVIDASAPGLEPSTVVEFWVESGDGWVMNRGQAASPQLEYFAWEGLVYGSWFEPAEVLEATIDGDAVGTVTADELGRIELYVDLSPGSAVALSNERVTVDLGPIPAIAIGGIEGTAVSGTADVPDGTLLQVDVEQGAFQDATEVSADGGEWTFEANLGGPDRQVYVRWTDAEGDQLVLQWIEE